MSGLVCVLDATTRPLMPMAPAHARRLLTRGLASRVRHHAFSVITLRRAVPEPYLRPVVGYLHLDSLVTTLTLIAYGHTALHSLSTIVIDVSVSGTFAVPLVDTIVALLMTICTLMPLSHLQITATQPFLQREPTLPEALHTHLANDSRTRTIIMESPAPHHSPFAHRRSTSSMLIAVAVADPSTIPLRLVPESPRLWVTSRTVQPGTLCVGIAAEQKLIGILFPPTELFEHRLGIPQELQSTGVLWHTIPVEHITICISTAAVVFLPLSHSITG
jgi:hypothetical protein